MGLRFAVVLAVVSAAALAPTVLHAADPATSSRATIPPQTVAVEGEALVEGAVAQGGSVGAQGMSGFGSGWSGGSQLFWAADAAGSVLDLTVTIPAGAEYAVEAYFSKAPDYGQVKIEIGGQESTLTMDGYAPRVIPPVPAQVGRFALGAGTHGIAFKIVGKAPASSGYRMGLDQLRLYPVKALAEASDSAPGATGGSTRASPGGAATQSNTPTASSSQPTAKASPGDAGFGCNSTCQGNAATVYRMTADGSCKVWFRFPCNPYACDEGAGVCRASCVSQAQCARGSACDSTTGQCALGAYVCSDAYSVTSASGLTQSCAPYKCVGGACRSVCSTGGDCSPGYVCDSSVGICKPKG